jgi:hypothetical protein
MVSIVNCQGLCPFFQLKQLYLALKIVGYGINEAIDLPLMGFVFPLKMIFPFIS